MVLKTELWKQIKELQEQGKLTDITFKTSKDDMIIALEKLEANKSGYDIFICESCKMKNRIPVNSSDEVLRRIHCIKCKKILREG